jgi:hypothetical protein
MSSPHTPRSIPLAAGTSWAETHLRSVFERPIGVRYRADGLTAPWRRAHHIRYIDSVAEILDDRGGTRLGPAAPASLRTVRPPWLDWPLRSSLVCSPRPRGVCSATQARHYIKRPSGSDARANPRRRPSCAVDRSAGGGWALPPRAVAWNGVGTGARHQRMNLEVSADR